MFSLVLSGCDLLSYGTKTKTVLQVDDQTLSLSQFSSLLANNLKSLDPLSAKDPTVLKTFKNKITTDFIVDSLIIEWFSEQKLTLDPKHLETVLSKTIAQYPSDKEFREELAQQNKSYQDWRTSVEVSLKRDALFSTLRKEILEPTSEELEAHYQANKLKYFQNESVFAESLLLKDESQADIIKKLSKKTKFEDLFKEFSVEKNNLGAFKFGWIERSPGSLFESLFTSKKSDLIGPIALAEGYRLFKVTQRKPSHQRSFEEVKSLVKSEVVSLRESALFSAWLDDQIKRHVILKNTAAIDALVVETREE